MLRSKFVHNVGRIAIREDERFWIFPKGYTKDTEHNTCSPWFSYLGEKWQFVMEIYRVRNDNMANLYLWRKFCGDLPNCEYAVQLQLDEEHIGTYHNFSTNGSFKGNLNRDFGFVASKFFCSDFLKMDLAHCGLIKIYFEISQKDNFVDVPLSILDEKNNKDDIDEMSSEDEIPSDEGNKKKKKIVIVKDKGIETLTENLKQIFLDGRMSDAVLKVNGREFNVHKVILVARSPVFESMFQHNMAEKDSNAVDIPDCTAESFEVFLHYLYTGSAETMSTSNVYDVYYAADKYHVDDLREKCVKFMHNNISVETFCDVIALSLRHGESELQKAATAFFRLNIRKIITTVEWQKYLDENSTQANELLIKAHNA